MPSDNTAPVKSSHGAQVVLTGKARDAARGAVAPDIVGNSNAKAEVLGGHFDGGAPRDHLRALDPADGSELERKMLDAPSADVTASVSHESDVATPAAPAAPKPAVSQVAPAGAPPVVPNSK